MAPIKIRGRELPRNYWIAGLLGAYACVISASQTPLAAACWSAPLLAIPLVLWTIQTASRWLGCFFFAALLLPPLRFPIGNSGVHVGLAFAGLGLVAGAFRLGEWRLKRNFLTFAIALFFLVLLTSSALAVFYSGLSVAAGSLARVLLFAIPVYVFLYSAYGPRSVPGDAKSEYGLIGARRLYGLGVLSALFACVDFYYQFPAPAGYGPQFIWLDSGTYRRAQGVFYEASTLGNLCAFFLIMIAVTLGRERRRHLISRWALWLGAPILFAALLLSYSRGSLLNLFVALATLLYVERSRIRTGTLLTIVATCLAAGSVVAWQLFPEATWNYWLRLAHLQFFFSQPESVLSGRLANWQAITAFLMAHPWNAVLGIGYKTLPYSDYIGQTIIADNMYLSLLVETGIIGLAAFFLLNGAILRAAWRAMRRDDSQASFFGTWIFCFWIGQCFQMFSADLLTYWRVLPLYFWVLAMAVR
ncbi:MAG: O-antigen ligase family protein [Bryobacterales bacterium]|nr:O-antigen ligase family protein [Bryobacterales bacterium]